MIEKWKFIDKDKKGKPRLYIDGDMKDVLSLIKKTGNIFGRPQEEEPPFSFSLSVIRGKTAGDALKNDLERVITECSSGKAKYCEPAAAATYPAGSTRGIKLNKDDFFEQDKLEETGNFETLSSSAWLERALNNPKAMGLAGAEESRRQILDFNISEDGEIKIDDSLSARSVKTSLENEILKLHETTAGADAEKPAPPKLKEGDDEIIPPPPPVQMPAAANLGGSPAAVPATKRRLYDEYVRKGKIDINFIRLSVPSNYTAESFVLGGNRFAYSAAMSAVENLGEMYNPVFLNGAQGTGKTHLSRIIANVLSQKLGADKVFFTSGYIFSKICAVKASPAETEKLAKKLAAFPVMAIDDADLMNITEQNKKIISDIFSLFRKDGKQIFIFCDANQLDIPLFSSQFGLESARSWTGALKPLDGAAREQALEQMLNFAELKTETPAIKDIFLKSRAALDVCEINCARLAKLSSLEGEQVFAPLKRLEKFLSAESGPGLSKEDIESVGKKLSALNGTAAKRIACFSPAGKDKSADYMASAAMDQMAEMKIDGDFSVSLSAVYSAKDIRETALEIAEKCLGAEGIEAVAVAAPANDTADELRSLLYSMLSPAGIAVSCENADAAKSPNCALKVMLDLMPSVKEEAPL